MTGLERRLKIETDKNPFSSSIICFANAVKKQRYDVDTIVYWFHELVDVHDYQTKDTADIIEHLLSISHKKK